MINIEAAGKNIIIRGRTENKERYEKIVKDFKPYFYVENSNGEYTSLFGEKLRKVECDHPKEIRYIRNNFDKTYEADILYIYKYMIDNYDSIESEPIRVCFIDIETEDRNGFPNVEKAEQPILSICAYDNFTERYYMFEIDNSRSGDKKTKKQFEMPDGVNTELIVYSFNTEEDMLNKYIKFVNDFDFDVFLAWNGDNFDYPYIINRMLKLGVDPINLSPLLRMFGFKPACRIWLDLMNAYKKMSTHEMESYSLEYISQEELGVGKLKHDERVGEMWEHNHEMFEKYNMIDVWLMIQIERRKGVIGYFDTIRRFTFSNWYDVFYNTKTLDNLFLKCAKNRNIILPTKVKIDDNGEIQGARVIDPIPGIHENIAVADVQSLYPTAALTCNMSPETIIDEQEAIENNIPYTIVDDVCFRLDKRGFIPQVIEELWDLRQSYKKEMRKYPIGSDEYNKWDTIQTVTKFLLNSVYGAMLAEHFRLYEQRVGKSITYFGRKSNYWMESKIKEKGACPIAGDSVDGNSIIHIIDKGNCKISELFKQVDNISLENKEYYYPNNLYTETMDKNGNIIPGKIKYVMRHKIDPSTKKMYEICLTNEWCLKVTEDHSLYGYLIEKNRKKLNETNEIVEIKPNMIYKGCKIKTLITKSKNISNNIIDMDFDNEMYLLMGYFIGNGSFNNKIGKTYDINISCGLDDDEIIEKIFIPLYNKGIINKYYKRNNNRKGDTRISGKVNEIFDKYCRVSMNDSKKKIPDFMFSETSEHICLFLKGLFSADGSVSIRNINGIIKMTTIDKHIAEQVKYLLLCVGISSSLFKDNTPNSYKGKISGTYNYVIYIKDSKKYITLIRFIQDRKNKLIDKSKYNDKFNDKMYNVKTIKSITLIEDYEDYVYDLEIEETHNFFANDILVHNTDSLIFKFDDQNEDIELVIKRADETIRYVNESMNEFCEKHFGSSKYNRMNVEFEKVYSKVLFVSGNDGEAVKKRYAGLIVWKDGTMLTEPILEVKGFEAKRSDTPKFIRTLQKNVFMDILTDKNTDDIIKGIKDIRREITDGKYSPEEIAIPKGMSKLVNEYDKNIPIHVTGAKYLNAHFNGNITQEKVKYIYVSSSPVGLPDTHVISFIDKCPEGFIFNYEKMAELLIDSKFENILSSINYSLNDIRGDGTQLKADGWF